MRLILSFVLILAALVSALLLHAELTDPGGKSAKAMEHQDRSRDLLQLEVGNAPILVVDSAERPSRPKPSNEPPAPGPDPVPEPERLPEPKPQRFVFLEPGGTISQIAEEQLGETKRMNEVLELNGWTEEDARRLHPGTKVLLPPK